MTIVLIIIALIYCALPWYIEVASWIVNLFIPDTLPMIDELLMFVPIVSKLKKIIKLADIIERYWKVMIFTLVVVVVVVVVVIILN